MPWEPLPHEAELFHEAYIDESSWNAHHYLVLGALILPLKYGPAFEQAIIQARGERLPIKRQTGEPRVIKWEKVNRFLLPAYKNVVDAFFLFPKSHNLRTWEHADIHCTAVDLTRIEYREFSENDADIGYNKELYFLCARRLARRYSTALFHAYLDRRETKQPIRTVQNIINHGLHKYGDKREWPFRRLNFRDPEELSPNLGDGRDQAAAA